MSGNLDETTAAALGINLAEAFLLDALVDDAHRGEEERNNNRLESVDRGENIVQRVVREIGHRTDAARRVEGKRLVGTNASRNGTVGAIEVSTALELILDLDQSVLALFSPDLAKVLALLESVEPHDTPDRDCCDGVGDEDPVESFETSSRCFGSKDRRDRYDEGDSEHDPEAEPSIEISVRDDKVTEQVGSTPDDRKSDANGAGQKEGQVDTSPDTGESLRRHCGIGC